MINDKSVNTESILNRKNLLKKKKKINEGSNNQW